MGYFASDRVMERAMNGDEDAIIKCALGVWKHVYKSGNFSMKPPKGRQPTWGEIVAFRDEFMRQLDEFCQQQATQATS